MRRTAKRAGGERQRSYPGIVGTAPAPRQAPPVGPRRPPRSRRLHLSVTAKFLIAQSFALAWLVLSIWLSLPWLRELAAAITIVPAVLVISFIAYLPGWIVAFLAVSLLFDRQPPLRLHHPTVPVTVLTAARNEAERIEQTIAYVAHQDYRGPVEILVVDNGSTDGTGLVVETFGATTGLNLRCIGELRPGKSHALNAGLAAVRTDLVITLDADTCYTRGRSATWWRAC